MGVHMDPVEEAAVVLVVMVIGELEAVSEIDRLKIERLGCLREDVLHEHPATCQPQKSNSLSTLEIMVDSASHSVVRKMLGSAASGTRFIGH